MAGVMDAVTQAEVTLRDEVIGALVKEGVVRQEEVDDTLRYWDEPTVLQFAASFPDSEVGRIVAKNEVSRMPVTQTVVTQVLSQYGLASWMIVHADGSTRYEVTDRQSGEVVLEFEPACLPSAMSLLSMLSQKA